MCFSREINIRMEKSVRARFFIRTVYRTDSSLRHGTFGQPVGGGKNRKTSTTSEKLVFLWINTKQLKKKKRKKREKTARVCDGQNDASFGRA